MLELGRLEVTLGNYEKAKKCFESLLNTQDKLYKSDFDLLLEEIDK